VPDVKPIPLSDLKELMHKVERTGSSFYFYFWPFGNFIEPNLYSYIKCFGLTLFFNIAWNSTINIYHFA